MALLQRSKQLLKRTLSAAAKRYGAQLAPLEPALWGFEVDASGRLSLEGTDIAGMTERWGSPLHVVQAAALRRNVAAFQHVEPGHVGCEVFYSYKTNPVPAVLREMHALGVGAEVISEYELWLAFQLGVPPERIVYNGPVKSEASLREAMLRGVGLINANHREEIARLGAIAAGLARRPRVGVRVSTSGSWSGQFGAAIATGEALSAVEEAAAHPALELCALHVHLGAPLTRERQLRQLLGELLAFADSVEQRFGVELEILDLGGSLAVPTVTPLSPAQKRLNMTLLADLEPPKPDASLGIRAYVSVIERVLHDHYAAKGRKPPRVFLEPGRAMTGNTQFLIASVQAVKESRGQAPYAVLDAGINLAQSVQSEYHQVFHATAVAGPHKQSYRLAGPICSPGDVLYWACALPALARGDRLVITDAGAYFVPFATSFSFPQPAIVMLDAGRETLIRRAERFEDLIALDQL
jgi:diaminopimelate decarboxylase